jgi:hypothetical protein
MRFVLPAAFVLACVAAAPAADSLVMTVELASGTSDSPMVVAWVVDANGGFVKTLRMFSKDRKYFKDMTSWMKSRGDREKDSELDAVIGPTIKWKGTQTVTFPVNAGGINLLDGSYTIRIEQNKDKGGHYKSTKIPLGADFKGVTLNDQGYIKSLAITLK